MSTAPARVLEREIELKPEDVAGRHVYNARYFLFIADTFLLWYDAMDLSYRPDRPHGPVMVHLSYDFLRQVTYPGTVLCRLTAIAVGRTSLTHEVEIIDCSGARPLAGKGKCIHVWVDRKIQKPEPWPAELIAKCKPL